MYSSAIFDKVYTTNSLVARKMCRLLAYLGTDICLRQLLHDPEHSLEKQAWQPKELREARLNADGFGIGWYNHKQAVRYRQPIPIWNDPNLEDLSQSLSAELFFATVRSATPGLGTSHYNTQPFRYQQWLFMHNGYIRDFAHTARPQIRHILDHEFEANIQGNTDSEYIFALILHYMKDSSWHEAIARTFQTLSDIIDQECALLNIMLTNGECIYASRYAINGECPSLYYGKGITGFPPGSQLLVSEALNDDANWQAIDANQLITISLDQAMELTPL
jgi:glutamine amidotransferase